ncbi:hypothetical protein CB0940_06105 [Cercospora beticola]|uniref:Uncharacterized protein n=1 Tax=Cercospora beticola TaxID=122368 RepID=A0A2G5HZD3_CERBT|nr:hypothetical protein CB0940_06105 [Cercospora beticola]PIA97880.1 hypothetical protein CB0940_06105 [Cercospora beticola]WPA98719.1 hypothetical protein RHO25_003332 [Cercospora beticola]CAK1359990.1 unnamed protein product [Cercospora beticola]
MSLDIYVGKCVRREANHTQHWILILAKPGEDKCTWYHVRGGHQVDPPEQYHLDIEDGKRLASRGIQQRIKVGSIKESDRNKVKAACQSVPLQRCQTHTVAVLAKLEAKGLVQAGIAAQFNTQVEPQKVAGSKSSSSKSGTVKSGGSMSSGTKASGSSRRS